MPRKEKKFHFIYKTTNLLTGKYYIGMHSTDDLEDGYMGSGKRLRYSLNKYGAESHKREILEFFDSRHELAAKEREVVNLDLIAKEDCMNLKVGGEGGGTFTVEQQRLNALKSKEVQKGLHQDEKWLTTKKQNISIKVLKAYEEGRKTKEYFHDWTGQKHTKETKEKLSTVMKDKGTGDRNSQFGTIWITNGTENRKVRKDMIIPEGWFKGRTINE
jgi:hypothetical protein